MRVVIVAERLPSHLAEAALDSLGEVGLVSGRNARLARPVGDALFVVELADSLAIDCATRLCEGRERSSWLGWNTSDSPEVGVAAYEAGALAVLPGQITSAAFVRTLEVMITGALPYPSDRGSGTAVYDTGERVQLPTGQAVIVRSGLLAETVHHVDGVKSLVGIWGPGSAVWRWHGAFGSSVTAHCRTEIDTGPWPLENGDHRLFRAVRRSLECGRVWGQACSHPHLDVRVLLLLDALALSFGRDHDEGVLIDVPLTHSQLASALGTTRATLSRLIGQLRRRGRLSTSETDGQRRFVLPAGSRR